jgi:hypothetical protein
VNIPIGPHKIKVLSGSQTNFELAKEGKYGDSQLDKLTIRVRDDVPTSVWRETLVHEVLHHAFALTEYIEQWSDEGMEAVIRSISPYLTQAGMFSKVLEPEKD